MPDSDRPPTIVDVAHAAGVSLSTASKALNGKDRVSDVTRARVRRVAAEIGYRPNVRAQRLRTGRSNTIALITTVPTQVVNEVSQAGFLLDLALPIAQEFLLHDHSLLLIPPVTDPTTLDRLDVDGAIVAESTAGDGTVSRLRSRGVRVATVGRSFEEVDALVDRGDGGASIMIEHLVSQGAKHIAVIVSTEPLAITVSVLELLDRGIDGAAVTVLRAPSASGEAGGEEIASQALQNDPSIDAFYAPFDTFAVGAARAAQARGLNIPADVMVATNYDGRRAHRASPPLTALNLGFGDLGRTAARLLLRALEGEYLPTAPAPVPTLVARASTARIDGGAAAH